MMQSTRTTELDLDGIRRRGFGRLAGAIDETERERIVDTAWRELADLHGVVRGDPGTWVQPPKNLKRPRRLARVHERGSPHLDAALSEVFSSPEWALHGGSDWGMMMFTFPQLERVDQWFLPEQRWHWDSPIAPYADWRAPGTPGVHLFVLLEDHEPGGGTTLFIEGLHAYSVHLYRTWTDEERSAKQAVQRAAVFRSHPWLDELQQGGARSRDERIRTFMERDEIVESVGGRDLEEPIVLRVHEMVGRAGDAWLLHPLVGHSGAPNARAAPRIMRSKFAFRGDFEPWAGTVGEA